MQSEGAPRMAPRATSKAFLSSCFQKFHHWEFPAQGFSLKQLCLWEFVLKPSGSPREVEGGARRDVAPEGCGVLPCPPTPQEASLPLTRIEPESPPDCGLHLAASLTLRDPLCPALDRPPSFWSDKLPLTLGEGGPWGAGAAQPCGLKPAKRIRR